jgi:hypothetical protein
MKRRSSAEDQSAGLLEFTVAGIQIKTPPVKRRHF